MHTKRAQATRCHAHDVRWVERTGSVTARCRKRLAPGAWQPCAVRALGAHACQSRHQGPCRDMQRTIPAQAWSRHQIQVSTSMRPGHVATPTMGHDPKMPLSAANHVTTPKVCCDPKMANPCHDANRRVTTPILPS